MLFGSTGLQGNIYGLGLNPNIGAELLQFIRCKPCLLVTLLLPELQTQSLAPAFQSASLAPDFASLNLTPDLNTEECEC